MTKPNDAELLVFNASMDRCMADPTFLDRFYARFLLTSDVIGDKFANTAMDKQARVLRTSLYLMARAAQDKDDGKTHLASIAKSHSRTELNIEPALYTYWLECLLAAVEETDRQFDADVKHAWGRVFEDSIKVMVAAY